MTYNSRANTNTDRGSAFVELALFLPALALMLAGGIDFARVFNASVTLSNAAEVGAIYGSTSISQSSNTQGMQTAATNDGKDLTGIIATATKYCACGATGTAQNWTSCTLTNPAHTYVKVQTTYTFNTLFPIPGIPSSVPMTRTAVLRVQ